MQPAPPTDKIYHAKHKITISNCPKCGATFRIEGVMMYCTKCNFETELSHQFVHISPATNNLN